MGYPKEMIGFNLQARSEEKEVGDLEQGEAAWAED